MRSSMTCAATSLLLFLAAASFASPPVASPEGEPAADAGRWENESPVPSDAELEALGAVIGDVEIFAGDIFDPKQPGENNRIYRLGNRLHRATRLSAIRWQLLFKEGDPFRRTVLDETERLLRSRNYLYDAKIRAVRYHDNRVDLVVETRDVWTLKPAFSVGRKGGVNSTTIKLQDSNLLGTGKSLTWKRISDVDRDSMLVHYLDSNLFGTRATLEIQLNDNSDGGGRLLDLRQPFYSLDSRWAAGVRHLENDRIDSLYALGKIADSFDHEETLFEIHGGRSRGLRESRTRRWFLGATYERHRFAPAADRPAPRELPGDRTLVYPWIGFQSVRDDFVEERELDQMGRTEDLELGLKVTARLGFAARVAGSDREAAIWRLRLTRGFVPAPGHTLLLAGQSTGRATRHGGENVRLGGGARYYWRDWGEHLFFVNVEVDAVRRLDPESQLLLGGDSGLRGYPLRYQDGEERFLLSLEQRFFTGWYPFRLFYVGAAVFFDAGRTWGDGLTRAAAQGLLRDVGVGLRLSSSRSGLGSVVHFDVAFPLDGDPSIKKVQYLVETKASF